ncbi:inosose dehydratase [Enterococcus sp. AZ194]|uniref:sugar phosphate isomerase/epimerase family protein n=1 Tax=Enterococcus sp. AZ194 TaxID=2774629 RepID=UPI003F23AE75
MEVGYMTNGFGMLVGSGGGVTSIKEGRYLSLIDEAEVLESISDVGYQYVELFDGNLDKFDAEPKQLEDLLAKTNLRLLGVYTGANYIYEDAFEDELYHLKETIHKMKKLGAKHLVLGGGAVRPNGNLEKDYQVLAKNLDVVAQIAKSYGLIASYHPHLGSAAESPEQIDRLFSLTEINFCPDIAHLVAGGSDALAVIKKYRHRIEYVHLKDLKGSAFVPLGEGEIPLGEIITYLKEDGYTGDWLVEIDGYAGDPYYACETSYKFLEKFF